MTLKAKPTTIEEKYPNKGKIINGQEQKLNPDNYFHGMPLDEVRKKYIHFTVFMESLNKVLELPIDTNIETLSRRIYDLVYAANPEKEQPELTIEDIIGD